MALTGDLLLYESRKRAIERVREMQEETRKKVEESFEDEADPDAEYKSPQNPFENKNENFDPFQNNYPPFRSFSGMNNGGNIPQNKRGLSGILDSLFKGSGGTLNSIKGQLGEVTGPIKGIMDYFDLDSEKIIILMVMWALFSEKQDKSLLLALGYLLI